MPRSARPMPSRPPCAPRAARTCRRGGSASWPWTACASWTRSLTSASPACTRASRTSSSSSARSTTCWPIARRPVEAPTPWRRARPAEMSVLSDRDIRAALQAGRIRVDPYDPTCLQPSSVDLHLDGAFRVFRNNRYPYIDVRQSQPDLTELVTIDGDDPFILHPGEFVLGQTLEWVELPDDLVARLEGKSSLGRLGLLIHSTAGYVDPGWKGNLTLELSNVGSLPIALYQGMRIGQISFFRMSSPVERPYGSAGLGSKYQGQSQPTASAFHRDFAAGRRADPAPGD